MSKIAFTNVNIFDGSGEDTFKGEVLVEGTRIVDIVRHRNASAPTVLASSTARAAS